MRIVSSCVFLILLSLNATPVAIADDDALAKQFGEILPTLQKFCLDCHSADAMEGGLDLEQYSSVELVRQSPEPWQAMIQQLETGEMPPKDSPQPSTQQRAQLLDWTRRLLESVARARAGERGEVPLHRLSNTEYDNTIRDLTGVDLQPTSDFPADGAAGEGFTNAAEALSMSPALMSKYVSAAKKIADHAVLLPDGFRFSQSTTRRDQTDESLSKLRTFYRQFTEEGSLPLKPYIAALLEHHAALKSGELTVETIAAEKRLSPKYLSILWESLSDSNPSFPLDRVRQKWNEAIGRDSTSQDIDAIVGEVSAWFDRLWEFPKIGSYVNTHRQQGIDPTFVETHTITVGNEPAPGQSDVVLYLTARQLGGTPARLVWGNPRFVGNDLPTLALRDYASYGGQYEVDYAKLFAKTPSYLAAVTELAFDANLSQQQLATKHEIDHQWLQRWIEVADLKPDDGSSPPEPGRPVSAVSLQLLGEPAPNPQYPMVHGWRWQGAELPILISNASDQTHNIPGRMPPHTVAAHPTPDEFVAAVWTSPLTGRVNVQGKVIDAHSTCGNGVAWWLEKQSPTRSAVLAEGMVDLGTSADVPAQELNVIAGDRIFLAIKARDQNHYCDLTEIGLTLTEIGGQQRRWDLAGDVADNITDGNPHQDANGNRDIWSFVKGASKDRPTGASTSGGDSLFSRWHIAASKADQQPQARELAEQLGSLLCGPRPANETDPNRALYDRLVAIDGPLLREIDTTRLIEPAAESDYALPAEQFGKHPDGKTVDANSLVTTTGDVIQLRLPAALFRGRAFVVDGKLDETSGDAAVQFQVGTDPPAAAVPWDKNSPVVAASAGGGRQGLLAGLNEFRHLFPPNVCYPHIIPLDEVVCLKTFHREDEPLQQLFLSDAQIAELNQMWREHRFISKFPLVENEYLPLFIGFVTQDQPKELLEYFEGKRGTFQKWADEFEQDFENAAPQQLEQLCQLASRAYRRPLTQSETESLKSLYRELRQKGSEHDEAFRSLLARVFLSPSFLLHLESGREDPQFVDDWTLASRLSYFLWSSIPDQELRRVAESGRLREPEVLAGQVSRMLTDDRVRSLAIEFGTQWIHVRGFDRFNDKNEKLFPQFDANLRSAMYEESILLFEDLFRRGGNAANLIDADHTFLNETLAKHYGIEGVVGPEFRRVDGVKQHGRGGLLGLASVQTKQAGASRTSPVLRGNWIVETLLGRKLPNPPPNVPQLPESELGNGGLTMREITQRHVADQQCANCHQRIDPFGFALEHYDPIGGRRETDLGGLPVDASAVLRDGTQFEGIDGLRNHLMSKEKDTIVRIFYQRLLGYALRRSVQISDQALIDDMLATTDGGHQNVVQAVIAIVQSQQFNRTSM